MAKNSAASKGYRKQKKAKPFLTKKELIAAIVILVVFIIAMIFVTNDTLLFYIFPDGNLAAGDVHEGDIVSSVSSTMKTRYVKIGEIGDLEGYTREASLNNLKVPTTYTFKPEDEASNVSYVSVSGSAISASKLPESYRETMSGMGATVAFTDTVETKIQDHDAYIFSYTNDYYVAPEGTEASTDSSEEQASNTFQQNFTAYIDYDGSHTLCLHVTTTYEDGDHYISEDQVVDTIMNYVNCFTMLPTPEAK